ncbi:E1B 55K [Bottlenose dolphin adenovirus 1]|uniref:E1B 55 kDa protein n=1 Tax=Bottlenose dolphin adenovirus 1 TaxID=1714377 RepID=A0A1X7MMW5_9ADEN|nr:E1B 55K [Bottlenose dolphin adenovirus 1]SMG83437.1 E1B 55K [Bottlenose dolphin adenovirus 1]
MANHPLRLEPAAGERVARGNEPADGDAGPLDRVINLPRELGLGERVRSSSGIRRGLLGDGIEPSKRLRFFTTVDSISYEEIKKCSDTSKRFFFEQVTGYLMKPEDDWEEMIKKHAKIVLDPEIEYVLDKPVNISTCCYVVGNGAKVKITCVEPYAVVLHRRENETHIISGMWTPTFDSIVFERLTNIPGGVLIASGQFILSGCTFIGSLRTCVESQGGGTVRGCHFFACYKGIVNTSGFTLKVKTCYFERCVIGIISRGNLEIIYSTGQATYCFCYAKSAVSISHCHIINPYSLYELEPVEMTACHNGNQAMPLHTIHIARHRTADAPVFEHNILMRSFLYVGRRTSTFQPIGCAFHYSSIVVDADAFNQLNMSSSFDQSVTVFKILRIDPAQDDHQALCICGVHHNPSIVTRVDISSFMLTHRQASSCNNVFMSDDEW